jgi:hypothetical protein
MSNESIQHGQAPNGPEFEREDWSPKTVYGFLIALFVICTLVLFVVRGVYGFMDAYQRKRQPALNPLVTATGADTRVVTPADVGAFPQPRLETDERGQIRQFRLSEEQRLQSYGWVDQNAGIIRIPIDRAMDLIAERGLPSMPQAGTVPASSAKQSSKPAAGRKQ